MTELLSQDRSEDEDRATRRRKAVIAGSSGFFIDMFDVYLPVIALAPALPYFVSPSLSPSTAALVASLLLVSTLLGRPLGAAVFGHYADRIGRKGALIVSVGGFGALTLLLGLMPGYATWGAASLVVFIVLRFLIGIFIGGEYTAAGPLAMEYSQKSRRGLNSALIMAGFPAAFVVVSLLTLLMLKIAPAGGPESAYSLWGWRIPFFIGGLLAIAFAVWTSREVSESRQFEENASVAAQRRPLTELFQGESLRSFLQVFVLMSGIWFCAYAGTAILPGLLTKPVGLDPTERSVALVVVFLIAIGGYLFGGVASQRFGRRRFLIVFSFLIATVGSAMFAWLANLSKGDGIVIIVVVSTLAILFCLSQTGLIVAYVNERFRSGVRASAFGLGYSLAIVIPSFYAFYQAALAEIMPAEYTGIPLIVLGAVLIGVGAAIGPETRDVEI